MMNVGYASGHIKTPVLLWLINDCEKALAAEAYLAALCIALMLPDICSKANRVEKVQKRGEVGIRYKNWFNDYIGAYGNDSGDNSFTTAEYPCLTGDEAYALRCALLHEGLPRAEKLQTKIAIVIDDNAYCDRRGESFGVVYAINKDGVMEVQEKRIRINIRSFCMCLCNAAKKYYCEHKEYFDAVQAEAIDYGKWEANAEATTPEEKDNALSALCEYINDGGSL